MQQSRFSSVVTVVAFIGGGLFLLANLAFGAAFHGRALPGTTVAGVNVGWQSFDQVRDRATALASAQESVHLNIDGKQIDLKPSDLDLSSNPSAIADAAVNTGHNAWLPLLALIDPPGEIGMRYSIGNDKVLAYLETLEQDFLKPATNAQISISGTSVSVIPEVPGSKVDPETALKSLAEALADGETKVSIMPEEITPEITSEQLQPLVSQITQLLDKPILLTYQKKTFKPNKETVASWFIAEPTDTGVKLGISPDQVKKYLATVAKSVDVKAKNKLINRINGKVGSTIEGTKGLRLDQDALVASIKTNLLGGGSLSLEVPTQEVAFKTVYNNTIDLDYGRYIEVNLSLQRLWVWQDDKVIFETPITSGMAGRGHGTVQGLFAIYSKQRNRYLDGRPLGYNYNVFVQYWMPFHRDYGLHDASWRSSFGGQDYYYSGSHGCVNMPIPAAAWLYNWAEVGTPVWVHS